MRPLKRAECPSGSLNATHFFIISLPRFHLLRHAKKLWSAVRASNLGPLSRLWWLEHADRAGGPAADGRRKGDRGRLPARGQARRTGRGKPRSPADSPSRGGAAKRPGQRSSEARSVLGVAWCRVRWWLVGGDPGIGKSTLLLQSGQVMGSRARCLYVSVRRVGQQVEAALANAGFARGGESNQPPAPWLKPDLELFSRARSPCGRRAIHRPASKRFTNAEAQQCARLGGPGARLRRPPCSALAKRQDTALLCWWACHQGGHAAGPKVLEHLVDAVLHLPRVNRFGQSRLLRGQEKNALFGATAELGVFEMRDRGSPEVTQSSELFPRPAMDRPQERPRSWLCEGTRTPLVELPVAGEAAPSYAKRRGAPPLGIGIKTVCTKILACWKAPGPAALPFFDC